MKEILQAFTNRIKSPVFGYFFLAFTAINWKTIFFLLIAKVSILDRFEYFDKQTDTYTLLVYPLIIAIVGAIFYPWVNYFFIWLAQKPAEMRQLLQVSSENKILIKKQELEEARSKLLTKKEQELIKRAKRDEEIKGVADDKLREELQEEIDKLRQKLDEKEGSPSELNLKIAKLHKETADKDSARKFMDIAAKHPN